MSDIAIGAATAAAMALVVAGAIKTTQPAATANALLQTGLPHRFSFVRGIGVVEALLGAGYVVIGGPALGAAVGVLYILFAGFVVLAMRAGIDGSCGCFGASELPPSLLHVGTNALAAAAAFVAIPDRPVEFLVDADTTSLIVACFSFGVASAIIIGFAAR